MKKGTYLISILLLFTALAVQAARVVTVMGGSRVMEKDVQVVYVLPDKVLGDDPQAWPAVYLVHG